MPNSYVRLAVWSGEVELDNLELKPSAIDDMHLPISVTKGFVGKIHLQIPWASLTTHPVKVIIDSLFLQASPLNVSSMSVDELKAHVLFGKQNRLIAVEKEITAPVFDKQNEQSTDKSFGECDGIRLS